MTKKNIILLLYQKRENSFSIKCVCVAVLQILYPSDYNKMKIH